MRHVVDVGVPTCQHNLNVPIQCIVHAEKVINRARGRSECSCRLHFHTRVSSAVATELIYLHFHTPPFYLFFLPSFLTPKSVRFLLSFSPTMSSSPISSVSKKRRTEDSIAAGYLFQQTFIFYPTFWIFSCIFLQNFLQGRLFH